MPPETRVTNNVGIEIVTFLKSEEFETILKNVVIEEVSADSGKNKDLQTEALSLKENNFQLINMLINI